MDNLQNTNVKVQDEVARLMPHLSTPTQQRRTARVLMLHGYAESGERMRAKTRFLRSNLEHDVPLPSKFKDSFPDGFEFFYPTGPKLLKDDTDLWAWGLGDYATTEIKHIDKSVRDILQLLQTEGPFIGIVGFSTGSTLALILASLAERGASPEVAEALKLDDFSLLPSQPFSFCIMYSGCILSHSSYRSLWFPRICTPVLHFVGEHDTLIPRAELLKFSKRCRNGVTEFHPGGHFVAQYRACQTAIVKFVAAQLSRERPKNATAA
ncbi:alpha/beta-hydrolase [Podospora australis]|uniref:Alpha/beta-hydrolase n=1 Tax=Podospora australis TaxID=1536484 RepID=A0AAN6WUU6_9PEZI|nr:alpha/beta-hydrolase [Podospora australis]